MVTVDMSKTRLQISKRKRRIRRLQRRRIQKAQREHRAQLLAAGKAKELRQRAVQKWLAEEKRLAKQRETASNSPSTPKRKPRVRFAENVSVTEIPTKPQHKLPRPISSPIGVRLTRDDDDDDMESPNRHLVRSANTLRFALFTSEDNYDESKDPDFIPGTEEEEEESKTLPVTRPKRRIIAMQVPLGNPTHSGHQKTFKENAFISSPQPTDRSQSSASAKAGDSKSSKTNTPIKTDFSEPCEPCTVDVPPNGASKGSTRKRKHHALSSGQPVVSTNSLSPSPNSDNEKDARPPIVNGSAPNTPDSPKPRKRKRRKLLNGQHSAQGETTNLTSPKSSNKAPDQKPASRSLSRDDEKQNVKQNSPSGLDESDKENDSQHKSDRDESEIDAMFGELVRQKAQKKVEESKKLSRRKESNRSPKKQAKQTEINRHREKKGPTKYTEEGFRVMSYDEIKADQPPGLNGECPFDCSCCF